MIELLLSVGLLLPHPGMISRVRFLPDLPQPLVARDWNATASAMHSVLFNPSLTGQYLPLVWVSPNKTNPRAATFGMPSYVGHHGKRDVTGEGIAQLGALLGSDECGLNIREGKTDWLALSSQYFSSPEGLVLNNVGGSTGSSFWYEILPSLDFEQLSLRNPGWLDGRRMSREIADTWIRGEAELSGNFDHTSYKFLTKTAVDNKLWIEPDAAAGVAYLELSEGLRSNNPKYLAAASRALMPLESRTTNPTYEILTPYGALAAAYLNAEKEQNWDVVRFTNWCFEPTAPQRAGWGMIVGKWGGEDVGGLMGSVTDGGGYAFAMNTFIAAGTIAPIARYDSRFSVDIAKWLLNLSNAARLFYRDSLPADHQSSAGWGGDPGHGLAYEGLHRRWLGKSPFAAGDATTDKSAHTDFGVYGSGYVGLLAALIHPTNVPGILRIDLRASDSLPVRAYPTDLYWNPYGDAKTVSVHLGSKLVRPYDAVSNRFLSRRAVSGTFPLHLRSKQAVQFVQVPAMGAVTKSGWLTKVGGIPIDYRNGDVPRPTHPIMVAPDDSVAVKVEPVVLDSKHDADWTRISSRPIQLTSGGTMKADISFAWDARYLYFHVKQTAPSSELLEAPNRSELSRHWWDYEDVSFDLDPGRGQYSVAAVPVITLGWSSKDRADLAFSPDLEETDLPIQTLGSSSKSDREISGKILWTSLNKVYGLQGSGDRWPTVGQKLGCQPLLVDGTFRRQAYIGGARYTKPSGVDRNSRTLVLAAD